MKLVSLFIYIHNANTELSRYSKLQTIVNFSHFITLYINGIKIMEIIPIWKLF